MSRIHRIIVAAALMLVAAAANAQTCTRHDCSNDRMTAETDPVVGDERMAWDGPTWWAWKSCPEDPSVPCTTAEDERCYEIAAWPELETVKTICEQTDVVDGHWSYRAPATHFDPYRLGPFLFPRIGSTLRFVVRACEGPECGPWGPRTADDSQDWVEFVGVEYACLRTGTEGRCEAPCYPGAPKLFPGLPDC